MKRLLATLFLLALTVSIRAQTLQQVADSIRTACRIPALGFAIVSADSVLALAVNGVQRDGAAYPARLHDRFHLGSNTKAITALMAALLVQEGRLHWHTRFLDLFPELKAHSNKAYHDVTLQDLLAFRGRLQGYTYTFEKPGKREIPGNEAQQRLALARYFLVREPMEAQNGLTPSNVDYILAGLMLEKASQQPYKALVTRFGQQHGISFGFDYPNLADTLQPWGHDKNLQPLAPSNQYKMNWLLAAGNINVSLPDYAKFIRLVLQGLKNGSAGMPPETYRHMLYGLPVFALGWFNNTDTINGHHVAHNEGNAGAFITRVRVVKETGLAYIVFANAATAETARGIGLLMERMEAATSR